MTADISQVELQRARWRRALARLAIDSDDREDFATRGLASRLRNITVQLILLPSDPEATPVVLDDDLAARLKRGNGIMLDRVRVALPANERRTAHALAFSDYYDSGWTTYYAIHRSGTLEFGLGGRGGWEGTGRDGEFVRMILLTPTVARAWALLRVADEMYRDDQVSGPFQFTVAVRNTDGALLGGLGEGWAEPGDWSNNLGACAERHLLWHLELDEIPNESGARAFAYAIGDRLEQAWGSAHRRYLAERGVYAGHLDPRRVN